MISDYVKEWIRLGHQETINEFKDQINLQEVHGLISESFISPKRQQAFIQLTNRRYEELCHAIQGI